MFTRKHLLRWRSQAESLPLCVRRRVRLRRVKWPGSLAGAEEATGGLPVCNPQIKHIIPLIFRACLDAYPVVLRNLSENTLDGYEYSDSFHEMRFYPSRFAVRMVRFSWLVHGARLSSRGQSCIT